MKTQAFLALLLFFTACTAVRVNYDYEKETDFSNYITFSYYPEMQTGLSELDTKRLLMAIDKTLQSRGLIFSEEPDFLINIESRFFQAPKNTAVGVGLGGTGGNVGGGVSVGIPLGQPKLEREIQFDFVDAKKDMLFWQAVSSDAFKENAPPTEREQNIQELVEKVFSKYPPKKKG